MNNYITLTGRIGQDAEIKYTKNNQSYAEFSIGVYDGKDQNNQNKTMWVNIRAWKFDAVHTLKKGTLVKVEGRLSIESYRDQQGQNRSYTRVVASGFDSIAVVPQRQNGQQNYNGGGNEDIPF